MHRKAKAALACVLLLGIDGGLGAQTGLDEMQDYLSQRYRPVGGHIPCVRPSTYRRYGRLPFERFTILEAPKDKRPAPLMIFIDGLPWSTIRRGEFPFECLPARLGEQGYAFALALHGRVPSQQSPEEAIASMAQAIAAIASQAEQHGLDPKRIIIAGFDGGGQLAALLGTDHHWLERAGVPTSSIRGIYIVNGTGFDLAELASDKWHSFEKEVGTDPRTLAELSPINHVASPNAPAFLLQSAYDNRVSVDQSQAFCDALKRAGGDATCEVFPKPNPEDRRTELGGLGDNAPTKGLATFLTRLR